MCKRLLREQSGTTMALTAVSMTVLLLFAGLALDFGRAHLLRASLQTAVDAGALAGALQVIPLVDIEVDRAVEVDDTCLDPVTKKPYACTHIEPTTPATAHGPRYELITQGGWVNAVAGQCGGRYHCGGNPTIVHEELYLPPSTPAVAQQAFFENTGFTQAGATLTGPPRVGVNHAKSEVTVAATITTRTSFLKLVGMQELTITRTGSAVPVRR